MAHPRFLRFTFSVIIVTARPRILALLLATALPVSLPARAIDWKPDPSLNLPDQRIRLYKVARTFCDNHYDPAVNCIMKEAKHPQPHMMRETLNYAFGLLMTTDPKDRAFAESVIKTCLTKQNLDPKSYYYGSFLPFYEDNWATIVNSDQNYGQFLAMGLANILEQDNEQGHLLSPDLRKKMEDAFRLAVAFTIRRDVDPGYVNISILSAAVGAAADKLLHYSGAKEFALGKVYWLLARCQPGTTFTEYLAPTYYGGDLGAAYAFKAFATTPELQKPADEIIDAFWRDIAASYHAPTFNLGGPQSRAYGDNMVEYVAGLKYPLFFALGGKYPLKDDQTEHGWDLAGLFYLVKTEIEPRPEFQLAPEPWREVQVADRPGMVMKAGDVTAGSTTIANVLEQARAYAMANNTYVFVGIEETDVSKSSTAAQSPGIGRLAIQAFASKDGSSNSAQSNLTPVAKLQILNNLHLLPSLSLTTGNFPQRATNGVDNVASGFPTPNNAIVSGNFTFSQIIAFNAEGLVSIPTAASTSGMQYIEYDLEPANGTALPATTTNAAAIQVDATIGTVNIYRP